jgi:excisionase family DNA binding protein
MSRLLRAQDVARLFNVDSSTVRGWIKTGRLPSIRTPGGQYRIDPENVARLMAMPVAEQDPKTPAAA